jgi:hypothetical protein
MSRLLGSLRRHARGIGTSLVLLAGTAVFLQQMHQHYPLEHWLFFRYASYWLLIALFLASCLIGGNALLVALLRRTLPFGEHAAISMALGVQLFALGWFLLGLAQLHSSVTFFVWPGTLAAAGARPAWRFASRLYRHRRRHARFATGFSRLGELLLLGLAVVALLLVYAPILTPHNVSYDARWYHLTIAERYAMTGGISRYEEGWFPGANPQIASYLYSWAFSIPKRALFDQVVLSAHVEFSLFLATLAAIPALVRRLVVGQPRAHLSWLAMFAFPGLFLYDSSLVVGADHVAAFWAVPIFLCLLRAWPTLDGRYVMLCGVMCSGPILTKYTAAGLIIFPSIAIAWRSAWLLVGQWRRKQPRPAAALLGAVIFGVTILLATTPHWLKNLVYYGNPIYPLAYDLFGGRPWAPDTKDHFWIFIGADWMPERSWAGVLATLKAAFTFSFVPNDWPAFHRDVPVFGSLFTLSLPCLLFIKRPWRLSALYAAAHVAVLSWYWLFHQDRYLQAFVPWMACGVAAVAISAWRLGVATRMGVVSLGTAQLVWGGDVPFLPGHAMLGTTPIATSISLVSTGFRGKLEERFDQYGDFGKVRKLAPPGSKLLLHEEHVHLGVGMPTISDWAHWQAGISYGYFPAPFEIYDTYRRLGVTHIMWNSRSSRAYDSLGGDLAFFLFVSRYAVDAQSLGGGHMLAKMPTLRPAPSEFRDRALILDCSPNSYPSGLYRLRDLKLPVQALPRTVKDFPRPIVVIDSTSDLKSLAGEIDVAAQNSSCPVSGTRLSELSLTHVASRQELSLWVKVAVTPVGTPRH